MESKNKIIIRSWDYTCGDRCCYEWGTDLIINGIEITKHFDMDIETLEKILQALNVEYEIVEEEE